MAKPSASARAWAALASASAPLWTPTANWRGLNASEMSRLSASISRPIAIFLIESAASSGRTLGRASVLPFLASGVTRLQAITS
eukprot:2648798-Alexandrium_andersonii.AAC.1